LDSAIYTKRQYFDGEAPVKSIVIGRFGQPGMLVANLTGPYRVVNGVPIGISEEEPTVDTERQTLSIMKACEVVGVSRRTIYNWMAGGKVEYVRTAGGSVRIFADSLWRSAQPAQQQSSQIQH
jgi:excisionase family DNA binding protein